jgi:ATP-dependent Clp protease adaptor protein ClpS
MQNQSNNQQQNQPTELLQSTDLYKLVVYNDEVNSFEWVIESFMVVCKHESSQAEQLAYLIHFKGKATVKSGEQTELLPFKDALVDRGISAAVVI